MIITSFEFLNIVTEMILFIAIWFALDAVDFSFELPRWTRRTFFIYVSHDVFLEAFEKVLWIIGGNRPIVALLDYLLMPLIIICLCVAISDILEKYFYKIWQILNGGR